MTVPAVLCQGLVRIYRRPTSRCRPCRDSTCCSSPASSSPWSGPPAPASRPCWASWSGLDIPTAGRAGSPAATSPTMRPRERVRYRREMVGFVWQQTSRNLLPYLTAAENVALPMVFAGSGRVARRRRARAARPLGAGRPRRTPARSRCPAASSSGSPSRSPWPTGPRCCSPTSRPASSTRRPRTRSSTRSAQLNTELGVTVVVVTHDPLRQRAGNRTVAIRDGRTRSEVLRRTGLDGRRRACHRHGVRRARPRRPAPAAADLRRGARARAARPARARGRPRRRLAGRPGRRTRSTRTRAADAETPTGHADVRCRRGEGLGRDLPAGADARCAPCTASTSRRAAASSSPSGAGPAPARRRCSTARRAGPARRRAACTSTTSRCRRCPSASWSSCGGAGRLRLPDVRAGADPVAAENVGVPLRLVEMPAPSARTRVAVLLELVGLARHAAQRPARAVGRPAAARRDRAGARQPPELLVADEPTGQLDSGTGQAVMALLRELVTSEGLAAVVATHDPSLVDLADEVVDLRDGRSRGVPEGYAVSLRASDEYGRACKDRSRRSA